MILKDVLKNLNSGEIPPDETTILIITSSYPSKIQNLRGTFIGKQVRCMADRGYHMVVLTPHVPGASLFESYDKIDIFRFPYFFPTSLQRLSTPGGMYFGFKQSLPGKIQMIPYLFMMILFSGIIIRKKHIKFIHTHWIIPQGIAGAIWKYFFRIPHISTAHVLDLTISDNIPILKSLIRRVLKKTDVVTVNSSFTKKQVLRFSPPNIPIWIIPMGMDEKRVFFIQEGDISKKRRNSILFVGRLIDWKGVDILIQAIHLVKKRIPDVLLIIVGEGPDRQKYEKLTIQLHLEDTILFKGRISDDELNLSYFKADLFILPSNEIKGIVMEGLGVVLLEAMASGTPVIGSNTGGIPDIIEDGVNGLLVTPGDPQALADAIIRILENPDLADRFRKAGLETVRERFSWDVITDQFVEVYQEILKESHHE